MILSTIPTNTPICLKLYHPGPVSYKVMDYDEACFMYLTPGVVHNFPKAGGIGFLSPMHKKIPDSYSKREGGNPGNSGLSSQQ